MFFLNLDIKVDHYRQVVRKGYKWYLKVQYFDSLAMEDKIEMSVWFFARIGWQPFNVGILQPRRCQEQINFAFAPEHVEIPRDYAGSSGLLNQVVQGAQLLVPRPCSHC
jgi:hypothetical protein